MTRTPKSSHHYTRRALLATAGKAGLLGYFVGRVMKASGGKANPRAVSELLRQLLG